jgi:hypothetical protein
MHAGVCALEAPLSRALAHILQYEFVSLAPRRSSLPYLAALLSLSM